MSTENGNLREETDECQACGFESEELTEYFYTLPVSKPREERDSMWLCQVCAETWIFSTFEFPRQHESDTRLILQAINLNTNRILKAIREARDA